MKLKTLSVAALIASSLAFSLPAYSWSGDNWPGDTNIQNNYAISHAKNVGDIQNSISRIRRAEGKIKRDEKQLEQDIDTLMRLNAEIHRMFGFSVMGIQSGGWADIHKSTAWKKCRDSKCENDTR
ncbi:MAG: hypothetical protein V4471_03205 [Pseudomonadota bacterium]